MNIKFYAFPFGNDVFVARMNILRVNYWSKFISVSRDLRPMKYHTFTYDHFAYWNIIITSRSTVALLRKSRDLFSFLFFYFLFFFFLFWMWTRACNSISNQSFFFLSICQLYLYNTSRTSVDVFITNNILICFLLISIFHTYLLLLTTSVTFIRIINARMPWNSLFFFFFFLHVYVTTRNAIRIEDVTRSIVSFVSCGKHLYIVLCLFPFKSFN